MSDCTHCATLTEVIATTEAANAEQRDQIIALNRSLAAAVRREDAAKGKLTKEHTEATEAKVIYACLDVWERCCWAGNGKPKLTITGERAGRVRKALGWEFVQRDICDAFQGLGLLPYRDQYNNRSATPKPGFKRAADVVEALRDEARVERFRDYYRRVQATPADRLREEWEQSAAVTDLLFVELLRARSLEEREQQASQRTRLFVVPSPEADAA